MKCRYGVSPSNHRSTSQLPSTRGTGANRPDKHPIRTLKQGRENTRSMHLCSIIQLRKDGFEWQQLRTHLPLPCVRGEVIHIHGHRGRTRSYSGSAHECCSSELEVQVVWPCEPGIWEQHGAARQQRKRLHSPADCREQDLVENIPCAGRYLCETYMKWQPQSTDQRRMNIEAP